VEHTANESGQKGQVTLKFPRILLAIDPGNSTLVAQSYSINKNILTANTLDIDINC
jgi:hypothetical protein